MPKIINERVIVQSALFITAIALYASTFSQSFTATDLAQSPMFFPRIILILWAGLNLMALIQSLLHENKLSRIASWPRIAIVVIATLAYTNLIGSEGFFIPSVVFAIICLPAFGIRHPLIVALFAIAVPASLVLLFNHVLGMPLPTSRLTYLF